MQALSQLSYGPNSGTRCGIPRANFNTTKNG